MNERLNALPAVHLGLKRGAQHSLALGAGMLAVALVIGSAVQPAEPAEDVRRWAPKRPAVQVQQLSSAAPGQRVAGQQKWVF